MDKLTESRLRELAGLTESPESELDKAIEKHIGDESFIGNEIKLASLRKAFVADRDLDQGAEAEDAELKKLAAKLKGKIFSGILITERGGKVSVELAVMGGPGDAKRAFQLFTKGISAGIPGFTFGAAKVKGIEARDKSDSDLLRGGHPLTDLVMIIHGIMPFTVD